MKKSLVLASLLAAFGAASAQSSVTLYGTFDEGFGKSVGLAQVLQLNPGTSDIGGFRFGVRGSEQINAGLKAKFQIETSDTAGDTGNPKSGFGTFALGNRAAWVGLESAAMGELSFGRRATVPVMFAGKSTNFGWRGTSSQGNGLALRAGIDNQKDNNGVDSRVSNAITYISPNFSGVTVALQHSLKNDSAPQGSVVAGVPTGTTGNSYGAGSYSAVAAQYAAGPLTVQATYNKVGTLPLVNGSTEQAQLTAAYNFGVAEVAAMVMKSTGNGDGFTLRAKAPYGAATVGLEISRNTMLKTTGVELAGDYALSPRTALTVALNKTTALDMGYYMGVRHNF